MLKNLASFGKKIAWENVIHRLQNGLKRLGNVFENIEKQKGAQLV